LPWTLPATPAAVEGIKKDQKDDLARRADIQRMPIAHKSEPDTSFGKQQ